MTTTNNTMKSVTTNLGELNGFIVDKRETVSKSAVKDAGYDHYISVLTRVKVNNYNADLTSKVFVTIAIYRNLEKAYKEAYRVKLPSSEEASLKETDKTELKKRRDEAKAYAEELTGFKHFEKDFGYVIKELKQSFKDCVVKGKLDTTLGFNISHSGLNTIKDVVFSVKKKAFNYKDFEYLVRVVIKKYVTAEAFDVIEKVTKY